MKKLLLFIALTIFGLGLNAQNVGDETTIDYDGYSLEFEITSVSPAECEVSGYTGEPVDVTIPSAVTISGTECSVTSIEDWAFCYCSSLTSIEIPSTVKIIDGFDYYCGAFCFCRSLTSITFGENSQLTSIRDYAFYACSSLTSIEIPNSVTSIGDYAFYGCDNLTSIEIPNSVTSIRERTFASCESLTSIEIPNSVTAIGWQAFSGCESLTSIEIPNSVTFIIGDAFSGCSSLTSIVVAEGNTVYDSRENCNAIIETSSNELITGCQNTIIPNSVTSIGSSAFDGCSSLTSIEIPNSVTSIGGGAFGGCSSLTSIVVAEGNTVYDSRENCNAIIETSSNKLIAGCQNTVIPNTVTSIGGHAFYYCSSLTSIEIPNSVIFIGGYAFRYCSSLKVIKCYAEDVPETGGDVFFGPYYMIISVPENSVEDYKAEYPWNNYYITAMSKISVIEYDGYSLIYIITDEENTECMVSCAQEPTMPTSITIPSSVEIKGIEYSVTSIGDGAFSGCESLTSIEIPNTVTSIGNYAFYNCSSLTSIEIPNSVTSIGDYAFDDCSSLTSIEIPNSVTSIGSGAFYYCSSLTSIEIPNSVTSIGSGAFSYCSSLTSIVVAEGNTVYDSRDNCNAIIETSSNKLIAGCQNTVIPNSVTSIGDDAFRGCSSLTSIEIPNSVTSIGDDAFYYCESLKVIKCYAENVPETENNIFYGCPSDMVIYVPENSVEDYKATSPWNEFTILPLNDNENLVPAVPDTLFAEALSDTTVVLTWSAVDSVLGYNVYSVIDSTYTLLADSISDTTYTVKGLLPDSTYCFAVAAFNQVGESERKLATVKTLKADDGSDDGNDNPTDTIVPEPEVLAIPENLVATAESSSSILLTWDEVTNANSYNIYQDDELIDETEETEYLVEDLEADTKYCFYVTAVNGSKESDESDEDCDRTDEEDEEDEESIEELSSAINIYPNPVDNELFLATELRVEEVSVYDIYGRLCCRDASNASTSNSMDTFNVSVQDLEAGVYFVNIKTENGNVVKRFVKN